MGSNVVVLAATAILFCSFLVATDAARAPSKCKKEGCTVDVIVAGAGLAGLTAARNLARAGKRVVVLEARKRVGGRCFREKWTAPNGDVVWYDRGGQWVGPTQFSMLSMIKEYNATTYDSRHLKGQGMVTYGGEQAKMPASYLAGLPDAPMLSATWGLSSTMLENMNASDTMLAALAEISASINITHPWATEGAKTLDSTTGLQWVEENYDNDFVTFMLEFIVNSQGSLGGQEAWATSLLHIARQLATGPLAEIPEKWLVNGAMGQFPAYIQAEIEKLGGSVFINSQVLRIEQDDKGVMVKTTKGYFKAKYLIVAMPPHLSAKMVYSPPLPILRDHLTQRMPMGLVTKLIGIYDKPFWVSDPTSNDLSRQVTYGIGDHPTTAETFDVSPPNGYGVIAGFLDSHHVVEYGGDIEMIKNLTLKDWAATWGPGAMNPLDFVAVEWAADPWTGGAYMSFATPGTWTLLGEGLTKPFGRIHWAGTETANKWPGYLDGAISSGENAAEKILKLLK